MRSERRVRVETSPETSKPTRTSAPPRITRALVWNEARKARLDRRRAQNHVGGGYVDGAAGGGASGSAATLHSRRRVGARSTTTRVLRRFHA